jgi:H+/Cl- antiporter ClcA
VAVVVTGVAAGVTGALLTLLLHAVQELAYGYSDEVFAIGVAQAPPGRRVLAMSAGGLLVELGWYLLRRRSGPGVPVSAAVSDPAHRLPLPSTTGDALLQITAVGCGASLGREGAPRQVAASVAGWWGRTARMPVDAQRTLIACGAGAGLAAVYNVPLAGALFTLEVMLRSAGPARVVAAVSTSAIATVVAWPVVGRHPVYEVPDHPLTWTPAGRRRPAERPGRGHWPWVQRADALGPGALPHRLAAVAGHDDRLHRHRRDGDHPPPGPR